MKALYYSKFKGNISLETLDDPTPKKDGVVIKVRASGLCRSDWHGWMGHDPDITLPHVPGHELAGEIIAVGKNIEHRKIGDRVTVPFVSGCGTCPQCASGNHQVCDSQFQPGFTDWGSFAEYVAIDYADTNLVALPEDINFVTAASLGCRFITAFRGIVDQAKIRSGEWVAIHGCGGVGLSAIMIAKAMGANVIAIDIQNDVLDIATKLGASEVINARENKNVVSAVQDISNGGVHVSMDALGSNETCYNSIANLRKRGRHVQVGLMVGDEKHPRIPMGKVIAHELEIYGSHGMQAHRYPEMIKMILDKKLSPEKLLGKTISLEEAKIALPKMNDFSHSGVTVINQFK
jgi:alcohol dehydrogenase